MWLIAFFFGNILILSVLHVLEQRKARIDSRFHKENRKQNKGFTVVDAQLIISIMVGLCLSAACGLKVFVPPLAAGLANQAGLLTLSENTQWLGNWPAITAFAIALAFEFIGFCIPVFGNFLDVVATPASVVAGVLLMFSQLETNSPLLNWTLAILGGGATSGFVSSIMAAIRAGASFVSAGLSNFLVATFELLSAAVIALLTLFAPVVGFVLVVLLILGLIKMLKKAGTSVIAKLR